MKFVFGTYRIKGNALKDSINQALYIFNENNMELIIDSATSYMNIDVLKEIVKEYPDVKIGWKIGKNPNDNLKKDLEKVLEIFPNNIFRVLLHNYYNSYNIEKYLDFQKLIETSFNRNIEIGICNINKTKLQELINSNCKIDWVQNEYHPFLKTDIPLICKNNNIKFEAHSCLVNLSEYDKFLQYKDEFLQTPAQLALAYISKESYSVAFNTINYSHLIENINFKPISTDYYLKMKDMSNYRKIIRYNGIDGNIEKEFIERCLNDKDYLKNEIYPKLLKDIELFEQGKIPTDLCINIPKPNKSNKEILLKLALLYFNIDIDNLNNIDKKMELSLCGKLDNILKNMRKVIYDDIAKHKKNIKHASCPLKAITNPEALPVKFYPEKEKYEHLNIVLKYLDKPPKKNLRFEYGSLCSDGRYDMCKQGIKNAFIESCESLETAYGIKHYLFGNNKICENDIDNKRLNKLVELIGKRKDIITWFLAGNCINESNIKYIADELYLSDAKYIWLKMNPIKEGVYHLGRMITNNKIELLDLFNTGIDNLSLNKFVLGINKYLPNFKHLYLTINVLNENCSNDFNKMISYMSNLESLYIGVNQWNDSGLLKIKDSIKSLNNLMRFQIGSSNLTDMSLPIIDEIINSCPKLVCVELGSYKSTNYFSQEHNKFTNNILLEKIANSLKKNNENVYLGLKYSYYGKELEKLRNIMTELKINMDLIQYNNTIKNTLFVSNDKLRGIKHPREIEYIESIYRNEMTTL